MARKESTPSRDKIVRTLLWVTAICTAGLGAGFLLGMVAIGQGLAIDGDNPPSFTHLSANPNAHVGAVADVTTYCPDCADSYGVAAQLRAEQNLRMNDPFRRLGEVDADILVPPPEPEPYRYGGRLPDPEPRDVPVLTVAATHASPPPIAVDAPPAAQQKGPGETPGPFPTPQ
ncbi:MAG: hypothetical protein ACTHJU_03255 [Sphingopyxis sp.]